MLKKSTGNMYLWVTHTKSYLRGECPHHCSYCYVQAMAKRFPALSTRYSGKVALVEEELNEPLGKNRIIFIEHQNDLFADEVPAKDILRVLSHCQKHPQNKYIFQTKAPGNYHGHLHMMFPDAVLGTTIESNRLYSNIMGEAPHPKHRYADMLNLPRQFRIFVTVEPILDFDPEILIKWLLHLRPNFVNIGADSKGASLIEPSAAKVLELIAALRANGIEIRQKTNLCRILGK